MAATGNDNDTEQNIPTDPANLEDRGNVSKSLLSVLTAMQENLTSSNSMLRDLVEKKRKSTETDSISKRAKRDASKSSRSANASEKALTSSSKEEIALQKKQAILIQRKQTRRLQMMIRLVYWAITAKMISVQKMRR